MKPSPGVSERSREVRPVIVIGAGPAGLTAAYELGKRGRAAIVLEKAAIVGGLARKESYKGFRSTSAITASSPRRPRSTGCGRKCSAVNTCAAAAPVRRSTRS